MEEKLSVIIQTGFVLFLLGLLVCAVGLIILMITQYHNNKIEHKAQMTWYENENDPRTQLRRKKEEEAFNDLYFDRVQEFYNDL